MIEGIRNWLTALLAISVILAVMMTLLPESSVKKIAGITGGLVLIFVLLQGVSALRWDRFTLSMQEYSDRIDRKIDIYRQNGRREMEMLIENESGAYISEQAQAFGLVCIPQVETEWTAEEIPVPIRVKLDIPFHAQLSEIIAKDLGIDAAQQTWLSAER